MLFAGIGSLNPALCRVRPVIARLFLAFLVAWPVAALGQSHDPDSARIVTEDIPRFWQAFDARGTLGTAAAFDSLYLKPGTAGLRDWTRLRLKDAATLGQTVDRAARYYGAARASTLRVAEFTPAIRESFRKLAGLYPDAVFPDVYFLVGRLSSGGTTSDAGLLIGAEMYGRTDSASLAGLGDWLRGVLRPVDELPGIVAHELVHYQQEVQGFSLLAQSLREGIADFVGEKISGMNINAHVHAWVFASPERERELWAEFQPRMNGVDGTGWFTSTDQAKRPKDLGYFMGYRIAQSFYDRAADKGSAIRAILAVRDPAAFLSQSGYPEKWK